MVEVKICNFAQNQITDLMEIKKVCEKESGWDPPKEYLDEWIRAVLGISRHDPNLVKIALVDNKIVGYCISVKRLHNYEGVVMDITWKAAYIWDLYVTKECRNMGVGTTLLEGTMTYLRSIGVEKVGLLVNYWNENAKRLFEKLGFRLWSYFMVKRL